MKGIRLTAREREIVELICSDRTYDEVAEALGCSRKTVAQHVQNISSKLPNGPLPARRKLLIHFRGWLQELRTDWD